MHYRFAQGRNLASIFHFWLAFCLGVLLTSTVIAAEYRASSPSAIERVSSAVRPGDTVILTNGLWTDAQITFRAEGNAAKPIVLKGESPGKVTLTGNSWIRLAGYYIIVQDLVFQNCTTSRDLVAFRLDPKEGASKVKKSFSLILKAHNSRLMNCAFLDCDPTDKATSTRWISIYGNHNRVDHCLLRGKSGPGAMINIFPGGETPEHLIDNNNFSLRERSQGDENETICVGDTSNESLLTSVKIESNVFQACSGGPEIIANHSSGNTYSHNVFRFCEGAISLRAGSDCKVEGNYFLGATQPLTGGVTLNDDGHRVINNYFADLQGTDVLAPLAVTSKRPDAQSSAKGSLIAFNTLVNCKNGVSVLPTLKDSPGPTKCVIANNIIQNSEVSALDHVERISNAVLMANIVHLDHPMPLPDSGVLAIDPKLALDQDRIWRPQKDSPARGAAKGNYSDIKDDIDGQTRQGALDIGCDQFSDAQVMHPLLVTEEFGASWLHRTVADHRGERSVSREREVQE